MRTRQKSMIEQFSDKSPWLDNSHSVREFHAVSRESSKKNPVSKSFAIKIQKELQNRQTWILAPDIGQNPMKNRDISDERCFTLGTVVRCELFVSCRRLKTQKHSAFHALVFLFMNILIDSLLGMQFLYIQNRKMCLRKKVLFDVDGHLLT